MLAYQIDYVADIVSVNKKPDFETVFVTFADGTEWRFTDCDDFRVESDPDRVILEGRSGNYYGRWTLPLNSIKMMSVSPKLGSPGERVKFNLRTPHKKDGG